METNFSKIHTAFYVFFAFLQSDLSLKIRLTEFPAKSHRQMSENF